MGTKNEEKGNRVMDKTLKISEYIKSKLDTGEYPRQFDLAKELGLKSAILSHYKTSYTKQPPLELARKIYAKEGVIIWPYSKEAVSEI